MKEQTMTQQSFRKVYAVTFATELKDILNELEAGWREIDALPPDLRPRRSFVPFNVAADAEEYGLRGMALAALASESGEDFITITSDDMGVIIWLKEMLAMINKFLNERVPFTE
jgi:hypothetical protein